MTGDDDDLRLWRCIRDALLLIVDGIEQYQLHCEYTSRQLRDVGKRVVAKSRKQAGGCEQ